MVEWIYATTTIIQTKPISRNPLVAMDLRSLNFIIRPYKNAKLTQQELKCRIRISSAGNSSGKSIDSIYNLMLKTRLPTLGTADV